MIHIKKFIEKVSFFEGRQSKDFVIPIQEARGVRDELAILLADSHKSNRQIDDVIKVEIKGGSFK